MQIVRVLSLVLTGSLCACSPSPDKGGQDLDSADAFVDSGSPADGTDGSNADGADGADGTDGSGADPFADAIVDYRPGEGAGFGQDQLPDIVLGAPLGGGETGSLDVLSLGREGTIILEFTDIGLVDGEGPDLLVFENPFPGWTELGEVSVSLDGETWLTWPCDTGDSAGGNPGCAGVGLVWTHPDNGIDPTDPDSAGGDAFDLADLGLSAARFVRIQDTGTNSYDGVAGGFDLDAVAVVHGAPLSR